MTTLLAVKVIIKIAAYYLAVDVLVTFCGIERTFTNWLLNKIGV